MFAITDARVIRPGDPEGSVLLYRTSKLGGGRMPRVGSALVDERAIAMLADWIAGLPGEKPPPDPALEALKAGGSDRAAAVKALLGSTRGALALMRAIDRGAVGPEARREAIAQAKAHPAVEVRDLFERFIPESERVARLGEVIDPKTILSLTGDARRGREVFLNNPSAQCKTCHRLEGAGEVLGPDLAHIGSKYARAELLRQILEPSQTVDPKFATFVVETKEGQVFNGLLAERTDAEVVLKDTPTHSVRIPAGQVERMAPQARSLMPELLLRDLTAQQAADLLEFLGSLK
jgi:putative heme-binding domain-containing protein